MRCKDDQTPPDLPTFRDKAISAITVHVHVSDQSAGEEWTERLEHPIPGLLLKWSTGEVRGIAHEQQVRKIVGAQLPNCIFGNGQSFVVGLKCTAFVRNIVLSITAVVSLALGIGVTPPGNPTRSIMECRLFNYENNEMTIASDLLQQHIQTLVDDNARWQTLIADDILWELAYAPSLGHPAQLAGRNEAVRHATWFVGAVENFRFFDLNIYTLADEQGAVAEVKGEGLIKSTGRMYRQNYVVFLRAADGKIAFLREYFDPVRAAKALDTPILGLES